MSSNTFVEFCDLDIVSAQQCHSAEGEMNVEQFSQNQEEHFYKGNRASWWNFQFEHICKRDKLDVLKSQVRDALAREVSDGENVGILTLYHQPGAGGTTVAMHVLWDMHNEGFKCCLVDRITNDTGNQIVGLYKREETNPLISKPVLAVVDNEDEKLDGLVNNIRTSCLTIGMNRWICVLLVCKRRNYVHGKKEGIHIKQKLSHEEQLLFVKKYDKLRKRKINEDVDSLLGLNTRKEDFIREYIKRTVAHFVDGITDYHQKAALGYTALLNYYDPSFRWIPVSCFDPLLAQQQGNHEIWDGFLIANCMLEGNVKCVRISDKRFSEYTLDALYPDECHAKLMEQLFHSEVFEEDHNSSDFTCLVNIAKEIMKKRKMEPDVKRRCKFSSFIQKLLDNNKSEEAVQCVEVLFEKVDDAFLAQQIARIFIDIKDWDNAKTWGEKAVQMYPDNSFLWDTYGQVYKGRLKQLIHKAHFKPSDPSIVATAVEIAHDGYNIFEKEHELTKKETFDPPNTSGLFGQIDIVMLMNQLFPMVSVCHKLSGQYPFPKELSKVSEKHAAWLQSLQDKSYTCLAEVEHWQIVYSVDSLFAPKIMPAKYFLSEKHMEPYRGKLNTIFFKDVPGDIQTMTSDNRESKIRALGGHSLYSVTKICRVELTALMIFQLASSNLREKRPGKWTAYELKMALASALALISYHDHCSIPQEEYSDLLKWSAALCEQPDIADPSLGRFSSSDPYVILLAFHWPMPNRKLLQHQCEWAVLERIVAAAKKAFKRLLGKSGEGSVNEKNNPLFFLTNKPNINSIISKERLQELCGNKGKKKVLNMLMSPEAAKRVYRFEGKLVKFGKEVEMVLTSKETITVPLLTEETSEILWNQQVYFALGIGLGGPVACNMGLKTP